MKCFQHTKSEAVGTCQSCGKGVCGDCFVEDTGVLYCGKDCAPDNRRSRVLLGRLSGQFITILFGAVLLVWALIDYPTISNFTLAFAIIMFFAVTRGMIGR